jgi:hypothetical protein
VLAVHPRDSLRRGDQGDEADGRRADPLDRLDRRRGRVAGGEHRVEQDDVAIGDVAGKLHVVLDRLERLLVAEEADEPDARAGDERKHRVKHPDPRAQDRAHRDLLARDAARRGHLERRLDLDLLVREVLGGLVGEEQRELVHELAEHLRGRRHVPQQPELVLNQRMSHFGHRSGARSD